MRVRETEDRGWVGGGGGVGLNGRKKTNSNLPLC